MTRFIRGKCVNGGSGACVVLATQCISLSLGTAAILLCLQNTMLLNSPPSLQLLKARGSSNGPDKQIAARDEQEAKSSLAASDEVSRHC